MSSQKKLPPIRRRVLSTSERERMQEQYRQNEREAGGKLDADMNLSPSARQAFEDQGDGRYLKERNTRLKRAMDAGTAGPLTAAERSKLETRGRELKGYLSRQMVPKTATSLRPGSIEFNRAKNMMVKNELGSSEFQNSASEWKNIQRTLHPDDPDAANLETIRPETA